MAENDDIPFNRNFPLKPGVVEEVRPGVRRVLCNNPSPFTFTGTVSYIVGKGKVAIIDPGPDDEAHAKALLDAVRGETVTHILVTHTHRDHSPNTARIKAATGAPVYAEGPHRASRPRFESEKHNPESGADRDFRPDVQIKRRRCHRRRRAGGSKRWRRPATPPTISPLPGRAEDQFRRRSCDGLVDLDRGAARRLDDRLHGLARPPRARARKTCISPATARKFPEGPRYVRFLIRHRQAREASILHRLAKGEADIPTMVRAIYIGIDPRLMNAAGYSVLAHLEDLVGRGVVATDGDPVIGGTLSVGVLRDRHCGMRSDEPEILRLVSDSGFRVALRAAPE